MLSCSGCSILADDMAKLRFCAYDAGCVSGESRLSKGPELSPDDRNLAFRSPSSSLYEAPEIVLEVVEDDSLDMPEVPMLTDDPSEI